MSNTTPPILGGSGIGSSGYLAKINSTVLLPCGRCGGNQFALENGFFTFSISEAEGQVAFGGKVIPAVAVICTRCGALYFHATAILKR